MITTDSQSEKLIEVDAHNQLIGPISRFQAHHSGGKYYRTIYVIVRDQNGRILIQTRSSTKDLYGGCKDLSVGGHVNIGEDYQSAAVRELKEELGIIALPSELNFLKEVLVTLPSSFEFFYVYKYLLKAIDRLDFSRDEISSISWMTEAEIRQSIQSNLDNWYPRPIQVFSALDLG